MASVPLLVTRAAEEAESLAARLGAHAIVAPCLAFEPVAGEAPMFAEADLLVASPRAAGLLAERGIPAGWRVLALAPATAGALRAHGLRVDVEIDGGGQALAEAARPDVPVVAATSDLGGDEVARVRPDAVRWVLYRTACPVALPEEALRAMDGPFDVLFTSPSAVRHFERLAPGALHRARRVLCHGGTTLAEAHRLGVSGERTELAALEGPRAVAQPSRQPDES